jgi:hypothetical protein
MLLPHPEWQSVNSNNTSEHYWSASTGDVITPPRNGVEPSPLLAYCTSPRWWTMSVPQCHFDHKSHIILSGPLWWEAGRGSSWDPHQLVELAVGTRTGYNSAQTQTAQADEGDQFPASLWYNHYWEHFPEHEAGNFHERLDISWVADTLCRWSAPTIMMLVSNLGVSQQCSGQTEQLPLSDR